MTLNYGIFDSADPASPDRTYTATLLSRIASKYLKNGIITGDLNEMAVTATDPPAMSVTVGTGTAIVQGRFCENDAALTLPVTTAHSTYSRIDRVVVRLSAVSGRSVDVAVVAGTPAASPVSPTLTQTSETWEIPLARIAVGAGVTSILTANITDERIFPDMTNLFKAAVTMMSNLTVGGDIETIGALDVGGDLDVGGSATYGGAVTFEGGITANLTGSATKFGGDTPAEYAAKLKCAIVSSAASASAFTQTVGYGVVSTFPAPLKSDTPISVYGDGTHNSVAYIQAGGGYTTLLTWDNPGSRTVTIPAGSIGIMGSGGGIYINLYCKLTI